MFLGLSTLVYLSLYANEVISSLNRYLETTCLSIAMLLVTYAIPMGNSDEDGRPSELLMGKVDPSTTEALLSNTKTADIQLV